VGADLRLADGSSGGVEVTDPPLITGNGPLLVGVGRDQAGVQKERPSLYSLVEEMKKMTVPPLVISGDEDWPCLLPGILMKQSIPSAALSIIPNAGHAINIEEPDEYSRIVGEFLSQVDSGPFRSDGVGSPTH
jgi:pimeloyl-ACP methyl ester carboxylesterase